MMDTAEFATFMVAEDAGTIVEAFNKLHGPLRATMVAHLRVLSSELPSTSTKKSDHRLLISASPENRASLLRNGPLLSETPEGRVLERKKRGHKVNDIAKAEFSDLSLQEGTKKVREILTTAREEGKLNSRGKVRQRAPGKQWKRRPPDVVEPIKKRVIALRLEGIAPTKISKAVGEPGFFIVRAVAEARARGVTFPEVDPGREVTS